MLLNDSMLVYIANFKHFMTTDSDTNGEEHHYIFWYVAGLLEQIVTILGLLYFHLMHR